MSLLNDILNNKINTEQKTTTQLTKDVLSNKITTQQTTPSSFAKQDIGINLIRPTFKVTDSARKQAEKKLSESRKKYNDYISNYLKTNFKDTKIFDIKSTQQNILENKPYNNTAIQATNARVQALKEASSTKEAQELKSDIRQKQNTYNYLQYRKNQQDIETEDVTLTHKLVNPITSGITSILDISRLTGTTSQVDSKGNVTYLPTKSELRKEKVREESSGLWGVYNDVAYNLSKAATAKAIDVLTGSPAGRILYYGDVFDDGVKEAKSQGFSDNESLAYGTFVAIVAGTLDTTISNMGGLTKISDKIPTFEQGLTRFLSKFISNESLNVILSNMTSEGVSEFVEEYVDNIGKYIINSDDQDGFLNMLADTLPDAAYSFLIGSLSGGIGITLNKNERMEAVNELQEYKQNLENMKPQSIVEAQFKNDQINQVEDNIIKLESYEEFETEDTSEIKAKESEISSTIKKMSTEQLQKARDLLSKQKQDTTQIDTELKSRSLKETKQEKVSTVQSKINKSNELAFKKNKEANSSTNLAEMKQTSETILRFENTSKTTAKEALDRGTYTVNKNGKYSVKSNEKTVQQALDLSSPYDKPKTIPLNDGTIIRKPSASTVNEMTDMSAEQLIEKINELGTKKQELTEKSQVKKRQATLDKVLTMLDKANNEDAYKAVFEKYEEIVSKNTYDSKLSEQLATELVKKDSDRAFSEFIKAIEEKRFTTSTQDIGIQILKNDIKNQKVDPIKTFKITEVLDQIANTATEASQRLNNMKKLYSDDELGCTILLNKIFRKAYLEDSKKPKNNNEEWRRQNDPTIKTNNSKYRPSEENLMEFSKAVGKVYANIEKYGDNSVETKKAKLEVTTLTRKMIPNSFSNSVKSLWYSGMLSSSRIWITNATSNVFVLPMNALRGVTRSIIEKPLTKTTGLKTTTKVSAKSAVTFITKGFKQGLSESVDGYKYDITNSNSKYFENIKVSDSKKFIDEFEASTSNRIWTGKIGKESKSNVITETIANGLNKYIKATNFAMSLGDETFRAGYYNASIESQKYNKAQINAQKTGKNTVYSLAEKKSGNIEIRYITPEGDTVFQSVNKNNFDMNIDNFLEQNNLDIIKVDESMEKIANTTADEFIYTNENEISRGLSGLRENLNKVMPIKIGDVGLGDMVLKFTRVPANVVNTLYRSTLIPLGTELPNKFKTYKQALKGNDINQIALAQNDLVKTVGDSLAGTIGFVISYGIVNALKDNIVGAEKEDKEGDYLKNIYGEKEYSIKIGDHYFSYDYGNVSTMMLSMMTDLSKAQDETDDWLDLLNQIKDPISNLILDQTFVSSMSDFFGSQYSSDFKDALVDQLSSVPSQFVPGVLKDIATVIDDFTSRNAYEGNTFEKAINQIKAKIPVLRSDLPEQYDSWGDVKQVGGDALTNFFNTFIKSSGSSIDKSNELSDEILNVYRNTLNSSVIPHELTSYFSYNSTRYDYPDEDYNKYNSQYIQTYCDSLDKLFKTSAYKTGSDDEKAELIQQVYTYAKEYVKSNYLDSIGVEYAPSKQLIIKTDAFKADSIKNLIENNMTLDNANALTNNANTYHYSRLFFDDYSTYSETTNTIQNIQQQQYESSSERKTAVVQYVNTLSLSKIQKIILIRQFYTSLYKSYETEVSDYLKKNTNSQEEYEYAMKKVGFLK